MSHSALLAPLSAPPNTRSHPMLRAKPWGKSNPPRLKKTVQDFASLLPNNV